jgi:hypothetical protein
MGAAAGSGTGSGECISPHPGPAACLAGSKVRKGRFKNIPAVQNPGFLGDWKI